MRYFIFSLVLHTLLFFSYWRWPVTIPAFEEKDQVVEIKIERTNQFVKNQKLAKKKHSRGSQKKEWLGKIFPTNVYKSFLNSHDGSESQTSRWHENGYTLKDNPNVEWGAGGGTFERVRDYTLMKRFHDKVDGLLFYPGVLARHQISGVVNTRIVLDQQGSCNWELTKINANDPHLRIYILHLLKQVCDESYAKYTKERKLTNIDMSFNFSISGQLTTEELIDQNQYIVGNVLAFYRNSQQSIAEWHLGPLTGVFPIPWVGLDFGWLQENFERYVNDKDPLKDYKI